MRFIPLIACCLFLSLPLMAESLCVKNKLKVKKSTIVSLGKKGVKLIDDSSDCPNGFSKIQLPVNTGPEGQPAENSLENIQTVSLTTASICGASSVNYSGSAQTFVASSIPFTKFADDTILELEYHGDLTVPTSRSGSSTLYGMTVFGMTASNSGGETLLRAENTNDGGTVRSTMTGLYASVPAGSHTVDFYVRGVNGGSSGQNASLNPGCYSANYVTVRELRIPE